MSLADAIAAAAATKGPNCTIGLTLNRLNDKERSELLAALADPDTPHTQIARGVTAYGYTVRAHTVSRHRAGDCTCGTR